ncbi:MAG: hypothetical protein NC299_07650 [Lachnospiraceae bacterium]|nr:hypothetical protein [Ruminococcus sp.]MCM1275228.1 hypothetical protein [Lachnospiraceae bacterium]
MKLNKKTVDLGFAASLMISGIIGITMGVTGILDVEIPDALRIIIGVISLIDVAALGFFSVLKIKNAKGS